jgi:23S rRNA (guanosine2251-2'-O)-methyltransferase
MALQSAEWIYGILPVKEALRAGRREVLEIWMPQGFRNPRLRLIREMAGKIPVHEVSPNELKRKSQGGLHQGVLAQVTAFPWTQLEVLEEKGPLLLLDGIQDPQNLGAIIRSSVAFGVKGVVVEKHRIAPMSPVVAKAACGALEHAILCRVANLPMAIKKLKKKGLWVVGMGEDGGVPIWEIDLPECAAVVIGAEGAGVRPIVEKACDFWVSIPTTGVIRTLNASVASAVILYELLRSVTLRSKEKG